MTTTLLDFAILLALTFGFAGFIVAAGLYCFVRVIIAWYKRKNEKTLLGK